MYFQNVNGIRTKLEALRKNISSCPYDFISLCETNLSEDISSSELDFSGYNIYRTDRSKETSVKSSKGGVMLAVNKKYPSWQQNTSIKNIECVFVGVQVLTFMLLICTAYIPPGSSSFIYNCFSDAVEEVFGGSNQFKMVVIAGDFNQPTTDWLSPSLTALNTCSSILYNLASFLNLTQCNKIKNYRGVLLDLLFTSEPVEVSTAEDPLLPEEDAHPALSFQLHFKGASSHLEPIYIPNVRKCNIAAVARWLACQSYPSQPASGVEESFSYFCRELVSTIHQNCPMRRVGYSHFPIWFTAELKILVIHKKFVHRLYRSTLNTAYLYEFRRLRSECKRISEECRKNYLERVNKAVQENPKTFWSFVKQLRTPNETSTKIKYNDQESVEPIQASNLFIDFFNTIFKISSTPTPYYNYDSPVSISTINISAVDIETKLGNLDASKGPGPDGIYPVCLKLLNSIIAPHLAIYWKQCISQGIFPHILKPGHIVPIFKSGDPTNVQNYRPIVILNTLSKVFESILLEKLNFEFKNLLINEQHGFREGKSTSTHLTIFYEYILAAFSRGNQVDCIYTDFSKAFDRVSHAHLLAKLESLGISGSLLQWFSSYLSCRPLAVRYGSAVSRSIIAASGVPQGSHLGPFLFNLFINDIGQNITVKYLLFADDLKLFYEIKTPQDQIQLQNNLDIVNKWCTINSMDLNVEKCKTMTFCRTHRSRLFQYNVRGVVLEHVTEIRDLGIITTSTLHPGVHIQNICSKANSSLGFIARVSRECLSLPTLRTLYIAFIRSRLEYASIVWSPYQQGLNSSLERVQNRFLRLIGVRCGYRYLEVPIEEIKHRLALNNLSQRRELMDLLFLYKLINGLVKSPELLERIPFHIPCPKSTRIHQTFFRQQLCTEYHYNSTIPRLLRLGNAATRYVDFFSSSFVTFKTQAKTFIESREQ